mgnify:CR=1 FL=1
MNLEEKLQSIVAVRARIPEDGFTAEALGTLVAGVAVTRSAVISSRAVRARATTASKSIARNAAWLPAGQTLSALLSAAGRARMARVCATLGLSPGDFEPMRPWLVDLKLGLTALARRGALASAGPHVGRAGTN